MRPTEWDKPIPYDSAADIGDCAFFAARKDDSLLNRQPLPSRRLPRLSDFDYSSNGCYFITICSAERLNLFSHISEITEDGQYHNQLTAIGEIVQSELVNIPLRYPEAIIEKYVIMPNHLHLLLSIQATSGQKSHSISEMIGSFKSLASRECLKRFSAGVIFQKSFHDHIIRDQKDFSNIWLYIDANPQNWEKDCFFSQDG